MKLRHNEPCNISAWYTQLFLWIKSLCKHKRKTLRMLTTIPVLVGGMLGTHITYVSKTHVACCVRQIYNYVNCGWSVLFKQKPGNLRMVNARGWSWRAHENYLLLSTLLGWQLLFLKCLHAAYTSPFLRIIITQKKFLASMFDFITIIRLLNHILNPRDPMLYIYH